MLPFSLALVFLPDLMGASLAQVLSLYQGLPGSESFSITSLFGIVPFEQRVYDFLNGACFQSFP